MSYKIVRMFFNDDVQNKVIKTGLTLESARAHCQDSETSSKTCTGIKEVKLTERAGPWFDGYEEVN